MDIDFALLLVIAVAVCAVIWLLDRFTLYPGRRRKVEQFQQQFPQWDQLESQDQKRYDQSIAASAAEPWPVEYARSFFPVLAIVLVLRSFLIEPFQIPSSSMVPTLQVGDFILVNKYAYGLRLPVLGTEVVPIGKPQRGDVMVFYPPHVHIYYIKRVIGVPGDKVDVLNKEIYINGERVKTEVVEDMPNYRVFNEEIDGRVHSVRKRKFPPHGPDNKSFTVPEGYYFMMGDNRDNSSDSRSWGLVPEQNIVGKAFARWMHWDEFWSMPSFSRVGSIE
jgi:signal peptidase I